MSDTQRSLTDLIALLPTNGQGSITAQNLRDLAVSILGGYGSIYRTSGTVTVSSTQAGLSGWSAGPASGISQNLSTGTLTVPVDGTYLVSIVASVSGTAGRTLTLAASQVPTAASVTLDASGRLESISTVALVTVSGGSTIQLLASADVDSTSVTIHALTLLARRVG